MVAGLLIMAAAIMLWKTIYGISIHAEKPGKTLIISTGASYDQVVDSIIANHIVSNIRLFDWLARQKNYPSLIKPGRYVIDKSLSYNAFINMLRSGHQTPVRITFQNIRTLNQLAGKIGKQLETDSATINEISF